MLLGNDETMPAMGASASRLREADSMPSRSVRNSRRAHVVELRLRCLRNVSCSAVKASPCQRSSSEAQARAFPRIQA